MSFKYTNEELRLILEDHKLWINNTKTGNRANLSGADLGGANLENAKLRGADLSGANLAGTIGNMEEIKSIEMSRYAINYTKDIIQIGCQNHSIEEWSKWRDNKAWIEKMDEGALDWAEINLDSLLKTVKTNPAT